MEIEYLFPKNKENNIHLIYNLNKFKQISFLNPLTLDFCEELSRSMMLDFNCRSKPEIVALAFWLRKANLIELFKTYHYDPPDVVSVPRGTVLHISPSNVDTIFLYSYVISLLCGNSNIIRLSSKISSITDLIIEKFIIVVYSKKDYLPIINTTLFLKFGHDYETLKMLSNFSDIRIIWGGDATIKKIREVYLPVRSLDVGFADRFSYSMLNSNEILNLSNELMNKLIENFYNDSYLFNQKACSSPRVLFFIGNINENKKAKEIFFKSLFKYLIIKDINKNSSISLLKIKNAFEWAINDIGFVEYWGVELTTLELKSLDSIDLVRNLEFGAGTFVTYSTDDLLKIKNIFNKKDQTISQFGFTIETVTNFVEKIGSIGIDRIVPIGKSLAFNVIWDGYNLIDILSKKVSIK